jgi:hypothetical protein
MATGSVLRLLRRFAALAALAWVLLAPAAALACPYCAGQNESGIGGKIALGALIALPFGVAATIIQIIRSEGRGSQGGNALRDPLPQQGRRREAE